MKTDRFGLSLFVLVGLLIIAFFVGRQSNSTSDLEASGLSPYEQYSLDAQQPASEFPQAGSSSQINTAPEVPVYSDSEMLEFIDRAGIGYLPEHPKSTPLFTHVYDVDSFCQSLIADQTAYEECLASGENVYYFGIEIDANPEEVISFYSNELVQPQWSPVSGWADFPGEEGTWAIYEYPEDARYFTLIVFPNEFEDVQSSNISSVVMFYVSGK